MLVVVEALGVQAICEVLRQVVSLERRLQLSWGRRQDKQQEKYATVDDLNPARPLCTKHLGVLVVWCISR